MSVRLLGLGVATPQSVPQAVLAEWVGQFCTTVGSREERLLPELFRMTRVHDRGTVLLADGDPIDAQSVRWFYPTPNGDTLTRRGPTTAQRMQQFRRHAPPLALAAC